VKQKISEVIPETTAPMGGEDVKEYERGWGSRPDGHMLFLSEEDRAWFLKHDREEKDQSGDVVPDWYLAYDRINPFGLTEALANKISFTERVFKVGNTQRTMLVAAT
jgi:hypothetical protein